VELPPDVRKSVFDRMNTERQREAREHRSRGQEEAEGIRAGADREKIVIESEAYREAEIIRGKGDAMSSSIYAKAYNRNAEFYAFWRSLKAYEETFSNRSDVMVLQPDSDFFRYLNSSKAR
jgi:membrane protease subunit HflC